MNRTLAAALVLAALAACEQTPPLVDPPMETSSPGPAAAAPATAAPSGGGAPAADPEAAAPAQVYATEGVVKSIEGERVTIEHEEVPGYMQAMTMPFFAREPGALEGLAAGDRVRFRFTPPADGARHMIVSIEKR